MIESLKGKTCVVTGGARGIGKSLAFKYAENGANVALIDLNEAEILETTEKIKTLGVCVLPIIADVSSASEIENAFLKIEEEFITIDVLANCVGISTSRLIIDIEEDEWDRVFNINLKSFFMLSKATAKNMIKSQVGSGKIISISSQASKIGELGNGAYSASKAGVNSLTQVLALELAKYGISVNTVCPGYVNTEMLQKVFQKRSKIEGKSPIEYEKELKGEVPVGRLCQPEEVADLMLFLSSEKASYITGTALTIAGGKTII